MKTFILFLAVLAAPLASQEKQPQNTSPPETNEQSTSAQTSHIEAHPPAQQPQTVVTPTAKPAQTPPSQQLITFTTEQLNEYENKILDRAETFYNNRMTQILRTVSILVTIAVLVIPLFVGVLLPIISEKQRKISFAKELDNQSKKIDERLSQSEDSLKKYAEEQSEKLKNELVNRYDNLTNMTSSSLYLIFTAIGNLYSTETLPRACSLTLQSFVLSMKFYIIGQCPGVIPTVSDMIHCVTYQGRDANITIGTLKVIDEEIENMKGDIEKIIDTQKRADTKSQVKDLQIFVHALIHAKQQTTPPQAG